MNTYLLLKYLHILSSVVLVGVGFGSAFYLFFANRSRNVAAIAEVSRLVVRADWWFTTPAMILQPLSGAALVSVAGYPWTAQWVLASCTLLVLAGLCWLPVVWLQIRMARLATTAREDATSLPGSYFQYARWWTALGVIAFPATLIIYGLMVFKPS